MRLPRNISRGALSRRAFLADALAAALLAAVAIFVAAGIGVVGFGALAVFLGLGAWIAVEALVRAMSRRRRKAVDSGPKRLPLSDEPDSR